MLNGTEIVARRHRNIFIGNLIEGISFLLWVQQSWYLGHRKIKVKKNHSTDYA